MAETRSCRDRIRGAVNLRLLGGFGVSRDGSQAPLPSRKARALVTYLVSRRGQPIARDALTSLLWPDSPPAAARHSLRQALCQLRRTLGAGTIESLAGGDLRLATGPALVVDVDLFEEATTRAASSHRDEAETCGTAAMRLYRGDLLSGVELAGAGPFEEWLATERARLRDLALATLARLETLCERRGDPRAAAHFAERSLRLDDLSETAARRLAALLAASGLRSRALEELERLRERLARELDAAPEPETTRLVERLRSGAVPPDPSDARAPPGAPAHVPVLPLVERGAAHHALRHEWEAVRRGASRCSLLLGEGGAGKTRLARTAIDDLVASDDVAVLSTCGCAATLAFPGALLARLLAAPELEPLFAEVSGRCPTLLRETTPATFAPGRSATPTAVVVLLDDLDALDPGREEALVALAARLAAVAPVWWLATALVGDRERSVAVARRIARSLDSPLRPLELRPLSAEAVDQLAFSLLDDEDARRLVALATRAEARLPLEVAELFTLLADLGALAQGLDGSWRFDPRIETIEVPRGLAQLLDRRIASLPPSARRLLALAAVAGPCFDLRRLARAEREDEAIVERAADTLVERWFLRPLPASWHGSRENRAGSIHLDAPFRRGFEFAQRTTRRRLLETIEPARRRRLVERLEGSSGAATLPGSGDEAGVGRLPVSRR